MPEPTARGRTPRRCRGPSDPCPRSLGRKMRTRIRVRLDRKPGGPAVGQLMRPARTRPTPGVCPQKSAPRRHCPPCGSRVPRRVQLVSRACAGYSRRPSATLTRARPLHHRRSGRGRGTAVLRAEEVHSARTSGITTPPTSTPHAESTRRSPIAARKPAAARQWATTRTRLLASVLLLSRIGTPLG